MLIYLRITVFLFFFFKYFTLNSKGEIKSEDNCLDFNGYDLYLRECDNLGQNQKWEYKVYRKTFRTIAEIDFLTYDI